jgi:hypothetical protein
MTRLRGSLPPVVSVACPLSADTASALPDDGDR